MRNLVTASVLAVGVVIGLRLLPDHILNPVDVAILAYVGLVSLMSVILTSRRTAIWTVLGVGVLFGAAAIAIEGIHNAAFKAGLIDLGAARRIGPWTVTVAGYIGFITDVARALLAVGYTYVALGWIGERDRVLTAGPAGDETP